MEGRNWILRSYKRALEKEGKGEGTFEEIAQKQWGSVEKIYSLLRSVGIDPSMPDHSFSHVQSCDKEKDPQQSKEIDVHEHEVNTTSNMNSGDEATVDIYPHVSRYHTSLMFDTPVKQLEVETKLLPSTTSLCEDYVTEAMINRTSAKLIKAELVGSKEKMECLQLELDDLRSRKKYQDSLLRQHKDMEKTVLLMETDRFGHSRPAVLPSADKSSFSAKGKSKRYVSDDYSLNSLVEMERRTTADDTYEAIAKMASKFVPSTADDVVDDILDTNVKEKQSNKEKLKLLTESRKMEEMMETCKLCLSNSNFRKHLLIAVGINVYLSVPPYQSLTDGHCLIVPLEHFACSMHMDENVWSEVKIFQKGLTKMFSDNNLDVIFTECYTNANKRSHMYIECIPIPKDEGSMAPMYFKKAILESDTEWAENRKLIDTRQKGLKNNVSL